MRNLRKILISILLVINIVAFVPIIAIDLPTSNIVEAATNIKLKATKKTLSVGKTYNLKVVGTNKKVKWSSSNKKVATVNSKGKITAKKKGTVKITAKIGNKKLTCKITVKNRQSATVYITRTGSKYHRSYCSYLRQSKFAISLKEAKYEGYTPCSRCKP